MSPELPKPGWWQYIFFETLMVLPEEVDEGPWWWRIIYLLFFFTQFKEMVSEFADQDAHIFLELSDRRLHWCDLHCNFKTEKSRWLTLGPLTGALAASNSELLQAVPQLSWLCYAGVGHKAVVMVEESCCYLCSYVPFTCMMEAPWWRDTPIFGWFWRYWTLGLKNDDTFAEPSWGHHYWWFKKHSSSYQDALKFAEPSSTDSYQECSEAFFREGRLHPAMPTHYGQCIKSAWIDAGQFEASHRA